MIFALFLLLASLSPSRIASADVPRVLEDVLDATRAEDATAADARLLAVWMALESGGRADALGDSGRSCGATQLGEVWRAGHSCAEVRADRVLAARLWLRALSSLRSSCGSTARALGAMSAGQCGAVPRLVAGRCAMAGVAC